MIKDWSEVQLSKHDKELQSFLGNLFLRATSPKIVSLMTSPDNCDKLPPNHALVQAQLALPTVVGNYLDQMEVGEALASIVDLLRMVRMIFPV